MQDIYLYTAINYRYTECNMYQRRFYDSDIQIYVSVSLVNFSVSCCDTALNCVRDNKLG